MTSKNVASWWRDALAGLRPTAVSAGLEQNEPVGALFDDELLTQDAGYVRVCLPVQDSPSVDGTGARWELPVRERYLANPFDTPDRSQWRTEVCGPLAPAD